MPGENRAVVRTSHVMFDERLLTFYLFAGSSLYAFCITPELNLEHLYFGPRLPLGYDLRFISANTRSMVFNTMEGSVVYMGGENAQRTSNLFAKDSEKIDAMKVAGDAYIENMLQSLHSDQLAEVS